MNILRFKRKGKLKNEGKRLLAIAFSFIMTTFAWFTYIKLFDGGFNLHINSWNIKYYLIEGKDEETQIENPVTINFTDELYPAMTTKSKQIRIENNGEVFVDVSYEFSELKILGQNYEIISENDLPGTMPEYYALCNEKTTENNLIEQTLIIPTAEDTPEGYQMPLKLEIECPKIIEFLDSGIMKVTLNWDGTNDELDTYFGNLISEYKDSHPTDNDYFSFKLNMKTTQILTDTFESVNTNNYGEYVDLSTDYLDKTVQLSDGTLPKEDGRILYKDDDYVYVGLADYLDTANNPIVSEILNQAGLLGADAAKKYSVSADSAEALINGLNNRNVWNNLISEYLISKGAYVVGGENVEFWTNIYNSSPVVSASLNYRVADSQKLESIIEKNINLNNQLRMAFEPITSLSTANSAWVPHNVRISNCDGFWLTDEDSGNVKYVKYDGNITVSSATSENIGVRPIIRFPLDTCVSTDFDEEDGQTIWRMVIAGDENDEPQGPWTQYRDGTTPYVTNGDITIEVGSPVTGYSAGGKGDGNWYILGTENGRLLITTKENVTTLQLGQSGNATECQNDWLTGVEQLNTKVAGYKDATLAKNVRSINVSDINRVTGYDPETAGCGAGNVWEYGNEVTYTLKEDGKIWYQGSKQPTASTSSAYTSFTYYNGTNWRTIATGESVKLKSNYYYYYPNTLGTSSSGTTLGIETTSNAYKLIFKDNMGSSNDTYWLGSQYVFTEEGATGFGFRFVYNGRVSNNYVYSSGGDAIDLTYGVRPAVVIKADAEASVSTSGGVTTLHLGHVEPQGPWTQYRTGTTPYVTNGTQTIEVGSPVTGYSAGGKGDGNWYILGAENGRLLITTASNVTTLQLGQIGNVTECQNDYLTAVDQLNEAVGSYKLPSMAESVRSINVDDINRVTGYDPLHGGYSGGVYGAGQADEYGNEVTYTLKENGKIWYQGSKQPETSTESPYTSFTYYTGTNWRTLATGESGKLKSNQYYYYPYSLTVSPNMSGTCNGIETSSNAYKLIFKDNMGSSNTSYWLGSQEVYANEGCVNFGVCAVYSGYVGGCDLYLSYGYTGFDTIGVRPAVSLKSDTEFTTSTNGEGVTTLNIVPVNAVSTPLMLSANANPQRIKLTSNGKGMYTKFNGNENGIVTIGEVLENLELGENWNSIIINRNGEEISYTREEIEQNAENISVENARNISIVTEGNKQSYNIYQVGNVYDGDNEEEAININDTIYLRRAIIGDEAVLKDKNFISENANTNLTDNENTEPDITDVILIRQKILTGEWKDIEE